MLEVNPGEAGIQVPLNTIANKVAASNARGKARELVGGRTVYPELCELQGYH